MNLNYNGYEDYLISERPYYLGGKHYIFRFDNDYGASVIKHEFSNTSNELWDLAQIEFNRKDNDDYYITDIIRVDDDGFKWVDQCVYGCLTNKMVINILEEIKGL